MTSPWRVTSWADRGEGNFTAWAKNQPNNFNEEDCVHALGLKYDYEWNDVKCSDCHQYTCKKGRMLKSSIFILVFEVCFSNSHGFIYSVHGDSM